MKGLGEHEVGLERACVPLYTCAYSEALSTSVYSVQEEKIRSTPVLFVAVHKHEVYYA